jgi:hypothetical protein
MKRLKNISSAITRTIIMAACGVLSVFLLAAGYEAVFNRSLPAVHTIDPVTISALQASYDLNHAAHPPISYMGNFGKPQTIKMPERSARFNVADAINYKGTWLSRANALHLLVPQPARDGNIGVTVLYCRAGFRTLQDGNLPSVGSNIFMDTDQDWRYVFKTTSAKVFPDDLPYIASDNGNASKLLILCNDSKAHTNVIIEATLLSVQGVAS